MQAQGAAGGAARGAGQGLGLRLAIRHGVGGGRGEAGNQAQQALHVEGLVAQRYVGIGGGQVQALHLGRGRGLAKAALRRAKS